jgi:hypothetical protein
MNDRFERNKRAALFIAYDNIVEIVKNELVQAGKNRFIRINHKGQFTLMGVGQADKLIFTYDQEEFFDTPFENFKAYAFQVISIESDVTYDQRVNQEWKVMLDNVLMKFQSNAESKIIDVVITV